MYCALLWLNLCVGLREQRRRYDILAQASGSRLSESIKNPSRCLRKLSLRRWAPILSEKPSHSGEEVSFKRENAKAPLFHFSSSRLSEKSSPERKELAWVKEPSRLSEAF